MRLRHPRLGTLLAVGSLLGPASLTALPAALVQHVESLDVPRAGSAPARGTELAQPARPADGGRTASSVLASMTLEQRVGQLFMVGTPATSASRSTLRQIRARHVGNVMLTGRSYDGGSAPSQVVDAAQRRVGVRSTRRVRLLVATDQEGGAVQVLQGGGFSDVPSALTQGSWSPSTLRHRAGRWARQLHRVGVTMNLAPVADTVPSARAAAHNPPIGAYDREFGYRVRTVARHARAFARGMATHGVVPTVKHFPGLGRVHENTDTTSGVTDRRTTRHDRYLRPFAASVRAGVPAVMMSTAIYSRLDPRRPAAFSRFVVTRMLRGDLGFDGVVISDDLGIARQVAGTSPGQRAVSFVRAGGDVVLTVDPGVAPAMISAVVARARTHPAFAHQVRAAALRVLTLKAHRHLL